ncbi:hypothetical protein BpHYR1_000380 [Brachionus plicatilis]|uniref:Uncharacterized protein n=1 Tax=Brachionus plicatilis TaxID=10195 RepID=A0A3M7Q5C9_BRAPC|nr:hypothetical protein BpHYR1_000380 [Brachionus plicatilis]
MLLDTPFAHDANLPLFAVALSLSMTIPKRTADSIRSVRLFPLVYQLEALLRCHISDYQLPSFLNLFNLFNLINLINLAANEMGLFQDSSKWLSSSFHDIKFKFKWNTTRAAPNGLRLLLSPEF